MHTADSRLSLSARLPALAMLPAVLLGACASGDNTSDNAPGAGSATVSPSAPFSSAPPATGSPSASPTADGATRVAVTVADGKVRPAPHRVKLDTGDAVVLQVTTDVSDEVHVHGVDKSKDVSPGRLVVVRFVVDQPGLFEVELENAGLQLLQLEVR